MMPQSLEDWAKGEKSRVEQLRKLLKDVTSTLSNQELPPEQLESLQDAENCLQLAISNFEDRQSNESLFRDPELAYQAAILLYENQVLMAEGHLNEAKFKHPEFKALAKQKKNLVAPQTARSSKTRIVEERLRKLVWDMREKNPGIQNKEMIDQIQEQRL